MIALTQSEEIELMNELAAKLETAKLEIDWHKTHLALNYPQRLLAHTRLNAQNSLRELRTVLQALGDKE